MLAVPLHGCYTYHCYCHQACNRATISDMPQSVTDRPELVGPNGRKWAQMGATSEILLTYTSL